MDGDARSGFAGLSCVVADDLRFKRKLGVGDTGFATVKIARRGTELLGAASAAGAGASVAASGTVAGTLFAGSGFLSMLGLATAATPVGWVVGAAVLCGGGYYGVMRLFDAYRDSRVDTVPRFINTNVDVLGAAVVDMLGAIALHVANADGQICDEEHSYIVEYFVEEWGVDRDYAREAITVIEQGLKESTLEHSVQMLADFIAANPDCRSDAFRERVAELLIELAGADGGTCEGEVAAMDQVKKIMATGRSKPIAPLSPRTWLSGALHTLRAAHPARAKQ